MLTVARRAPRLTCTLAALVLAALLMLPFFALLPADNPLAVSTYMLTLIGKILCYAIVAVALDLVWGYAGYCRWGMVCSSRSVAMRWDVPDATGRR
ncbi:hypothetical protein HAT93_04093 [Dickeya solani]|nr:hypothetical protein [Dickeya solani]